MIKGFKKEYRLFNTAHSKTMVCYTLYFENGQLIDVRNECGTSVEKKSDCWAYFHNKYNF